MLRETWMITDQKINKWLNSTVFSGMLTQFDLTELEHERKKARMDRDYEFVKMLCKL